MRFPNQSDLAHARRIVHRFPMERYGGGPIVICDYDTAWPRMFAAERQRLRHALGSLVIALEHVGSTAVPGLAAKPIIDVLVGVRSLHDARTSSLEPMQKLGYTYMAEYESWLPGEMLFSEGHFWPVDTSRPHCGAIRCSLGRVHPDPRLPAKASRSRPRLRRSQEGARDAVRRRHRGIPIGQGTFPQGADGEGTRGHVTGEGLNAR